MIGEFLLDIVFGIVTSLFDLFNLSEITFTFYHDLVPLWDFLYAVLYFLPTDTCLQILTAICAFALFRAVIRLIITIWDLLPIA